MARGLTLNAVLKLTKTQFDSGIRQVQKSLNNLKTTFFQVAGALGAGLGLAHVVSEIKQTAVDLSVAKATLENVSKSVSENAENFEYLTKIAHKYGQDLISLTQGFAKFRAAAGLAGLSLEEIKEIYTSLTAAAGAFHLSADQTKLVMMAVEQMFSKGKVTSEELRRQLGNSLPGAFGYMAEAAGRAGITLHGTTGELEAAMKAGKIIAKDVMPEFAKVLQEVTEGANFDSLQSSINRFSNAWTDFTEKINFEGLFKGIVDFSTKAINIVGNNFKAIRHTVITLLAAIGAGKGWKLFEAYGVSSVEKVKKEFADLMRIQKGLNSDIEQIKASLASLGNSNAIQTVTMELTAAEAAAAGLNKDLVDTLVVYEALNGKAKTHTIARADAEKVLQARLEKTTAIYNENNKKANSLISQGAKGTNALKRGLVGVRTAAVAAGNAIRAAMSAIIVGAIIGAIMELVQLLIDYVKKLREARNEWKNMEKEVKTVDSSIYTQIEEAKELQRLLRDTAKTDNERQTILDKLNKKLGLQGDEMLTLKSTAVDIGKAIEVWSDNIIAAAQKLAMLNRIGELTTQNAEAQFEIDKAKADPNYGKTTGIFRQKDGSYRWRVRTSEAKKLDKLIADQEKIIKKNNELIENLRGEISKIDNAKGISSLYDNKEEEDGSALDNTTKKVKTLKEVLSNYREELKKLDNQLANGAISQEEYGKSVGNLNQKTWKEIAQFDNLDKRLKKLGDSYISLSDTIKSGAKDFELSEIISKQIEETDKELSKSLEDTIDRYLDFIEKVNEIANGKQPKKGKRDTFFDYKKTASDILGENTKIAEDYAEDIQKIVDKLQALKAEAGDDWDGIMQNYLDEMIKKLKEATDEAENLKEAARLAELAEDVKKFKKEWGDSWKGALKDVATSIDRVVQSFEQLDSAVRTLNDDKNKLTDDETYQKFKAWMTILSEIIQLINTARSVVEGYKKAQEALAAFKKVEAVQDAVNAATQVAAQQAVTAAETEGAAATVAAETVKQAEIAATTTALGGEAVAGAAASQAAIPVVGPELALAAVPAIVGLINANKNKFAKGGIVGGHSYSGDNNLARVNSGEMILNRAQQANLWGMLNGKQTAGSGQVEFIIRGDRLQGVLNNYNSKRRG